MWDSEERIYRFLSNITPQLFIVDVWLSYYFCDFSAFDIFDLLANFPLKPIAFTGKNGWYVKSIDKTNIEGLPLNEMLRLNKLTYIFI